MLKTDISKQLLTNCTDSPPLKRPHTI